MQAIRSALRYFLAADTIYDIHAPRAFQFVGEVVEDKRQFYAYQRIEAIRQDYLSSTQLLQLHDAGAGSQVQSDSVRQLGDVARGSASPPRFGRYLLRCADLLKARRVLELGTNLGLGAAYLAAGMPRDGHLITIDADATLAAFAKTTLATAAPWTRVDVTVGLFADRLPEALATLGHVDLAFIDGHHAEQATIDYFNAIRLFCHTKSVVILDDIHWSTGMEAAWRHICTQPGISLTIDLYRWGVVFFDPQIIIPQHLTIVPWHWKPWHMGFFSSRQA